MVSWCVYRRRKGKQDGNSFLRKSQLKKQLDELNIVMRFLWVWGYLKGRTKGSALQGRGASHRGDPATGSRGWRVGLREEEGLQRVCRDV